MKNKRLFKLLFQFEADNNSHFLFHLKDDDQMNLTWEERIPKKTEILSLLEQYPVRFAYLFGSSVRKRRGPLSDIDFAIYLDPELSKYKRHRLRLKLISRITDLISNPKVDLVVLNDTSILFTDQILRQGVCFYNADPYGKQQFEEYILSRSLDFKIFAKRFDQWQADALIGINKDD